MIRYGKMVQNAVSVMSRLAELYSVDAQLVSSLDIAENRNLPKPVVAKIMTILAQEGLIAGSPGPKGGYRLKKEPKLITLYDVAVLFERVEHNSRCPFGPGWCGKGEPCPLHRKFIKLEEQTKRFLQSTNFGIFRKRV